ncbi:MAG TPA: hypothetical protein VFR21_27425 [Bradyrhizobium sp.]|jgi:hypothetical protein|nr:hypothetical protein [Bradyrhizobium sp.]
MAQQSNEASGDHLVQPIAAGSGHSDVIPLAAPRVRVIDQAIIAIAGQSNGPLTALLLLRGKSCQLASSRVYARM